MQERNKRGRGTLPSDYALCAESTSTFSKDFPITIPAASKVSQKTFARFGKRRGAYPPPIPISPLHKVVLRLWGLLATHDIASLKLIKCTLCDARHKFVMVLVVGDDGPVDGKRYSVDGPYQHIVV